MCINAVAKIHEECKYVYVESVCELMYITC